MEHYYNDFGTWIRRRFPFRVQKLSVDAGFSCPNRDGRISLGGCSYCDNRTFNPSYCNRRLPISEQLAAGKEFFARKYPAMKYLAYFQTFTNTYADLETLKRLYEEALQVEDVVGLVIGTRPDCLSGELLDYLQELGRHTFLLVEFGIESTNDATLQRINRGHTFECSCRAINETHRRGILTGGHIILGLPDESRADILRQAHDISLLPLDILKIHQLQVIKGTPLAKEYERHPFPLYSAEEYMELVIEYICRLREDLVLERFVSQAPTEFLLAPRWGLKNHEFTNLLIGRMKATNRFQGQLAHGYRSGKTE